MHVHTPVRFFKRDPSPIQVESGQAGDGSFERGKNLWRQGRAYRNDAWPPGWRGRRLRDLLEVCAFGISCSRHLCLMLPLSLDLACSWHSASSQTLRLLAACLDVFFSLTFLFQLPFPMIALSLDFPYPLHSPTLFTAVSLQFATLFTSRLSSTIYSSSHLYRLRLSTVLTSLFIIVLEVYTSSVCLFVCLCLCVSVCSPSPLHTVAPSAPVCSAPPMPVLVADRQVEPPSLLVGDRRLDLPSFMVVDPRGEPPSAKCSYYIYVSISLAIHLFIFDSPVYLCPYLHTYLSNQLSISPWFHLSIYPAIYLFTYLPIQTEASTRRSFCTAKF